MLEAAASGDLGALSLELGRGASLFATDLSGRHALSLALHYQHDDVALVLMGRMLHADPSMAWVGHAARGTGRNVLHVAVASRRLRVLSALLAALGSKVETALEQPDAEGDTPLHLAAREDSVKAIHAILKACPAALDARTSSGLTPLAVALGADQADAAAALLKEGAGAMEGAPPAWVHFQSSAMATLLESHLDWMQARMPDGRNVLHVLAARGASARASLMKAFLSRPGVGHLVALPDAAGATPLHVAIRASAPGDTIDALVSQGASWLTEDGEGLSAIDTLLQQASAGSPFEPDTVGRWNAQAKRQRMEHVYPAGAPVERAPRL